MRFERALFSSCNASMAFPASLGFLSSVFMVANSAKLLFNNSSAASPLTASILRTPAATAASLRILKKPISPVLPTCVPPHNSTE